MRLLNTSTLDFKWEHLNDGHIYAILSHRWGEGEVTFKDITESRSEAERKPGYKKLEMACRVAKAHGFEYIWIDTCCIDKSDFVRALRGNQFHVSLVSRRFDMLRLPRQRHGRHCAIS